MIPAKVLCKQLKKGVCSPSVSLLQYESEEDLLSIIVALSRNTQIKMLKLSLLGKSKECLDTLTTLLVHTSSITSLEVEFSNKTFDYLRKVLLYNKTITHVKFSVPIDSNYRLENESAALLLLALQKNTVLREISFYHCFNRAQAGLIKSILPNIKDIQALYFYKNDLGSKGVQAITKALENHAALYCLSFDHETCEDDATQTLGDTLHCQDTLQTLQLTSDLTNILPISQALKFNCSLTSLQLSSKAVDIKGIRELFDSLKYNRALQHLDLTTTNLSTLSGINVSDLLKQNRTLTSLCIPVTHIKDSVFKDFCVALKMNSTLTSLDLSYNNLSEDSLGCLATTLPYNTSLQNLYLTGNKISKNVCQTFSKHLKDNHSVIHLELGFEFAHHPELKPLLARNRQEQIEKQALTLLMGFNSRLGNKSSLYKASLDPLFDCSLVKLLFQFTGHGKSEFSDSEPSTNKSKNRARL